MILSVSFLLLLLIVSAALVGYRDIQNDSKNNVSLEEDEGGAYLSKFGFILNILFIIIVIVETLPVFAYLHGC
jgi:hypothetical protein